MIADMSQDAKSWASFALVEGDPSGASGSGQPSGNADLSKAVLKAQEAYDCCTRTVSSIREASKELLTLVQPDSLAASCTRTAVSKARKLEPYISQLEGVLFSSGSEHQMSCEDIRKARTGGVKSCSVRISRPTWAGLQLGPLGPAYN